MADRRRVGSRCAPRMATCTAECLHRRSVEDYRFERLAEEERVENEEAYTPSLTFRAWLEHNRGRNEPSGTI